MTKVRRRVEDRYGAGVVVTCRWLPCGMVRTPSGESYMAYSLVMLIRLVQVMWMNAATGLPADDR